MLMSSTVLLMWLKKKKKTQQQQKNHKLPKTYIYKTRRGGGGINYCKNEKEKDQQNISPFFKSMRFNRYMLRISLQAGDTL